MLSRHARAGKLPGAAAEYAEVLVQGLAIIGLTVGITRLL